MLTFKNQPFRGCQSKWYDGESAARGGGHERLCHVLTEVLLNAKRTAAASVMASSRKGFAGTMAATLQIRCLQLGPELIEQASAQAKRNPLWLSALTMAAMATIKDRTLLSSHQ